MKKYSKSDIGCFIDNSAGQYSEGALVSALDSLLSIKAPDIAAKWRADWALEALGALSEGRNFAEYFCDDIQDLESLLNEHAVEDDVCFTWFEGAFCLADVNEVTE